MPRLRSLCRTERNAEELQSHYLIITPSLEGGQHRLAWGQIAIVGFTVDDQNGSHAWWDTAGVAKHDAGEKAFPVPLSQLTQL